MITTALTILALLYLTLAILAYRRIYNSGDRFTFIYFWAMLLGAFVWEDLFIFATYWFGVCLVTLLTHDIRIGLLLTIVFWVVRSTGETIYFFLQQFIEPRHSPHNIKNQFGPLQHLFGNICPQKCFILMQITFQIIDIAAITCLILLVIDWHIIPAWVM